MTTISEKTFKKLFASCPVCQYCGKQIRKVFIPMSFDAIYEWNDKKGGYLHNCDTIYSESGAPFICDCCHHEINSDQEEQVRQFLKSI